MLKVRLLCHHRPDVVFLGNVSTARDSSSRRDMMSVFLEKLVDNGLYELVYNEQSAKEHPYGYPINLFRRDTMTVKSSTIVDVDPKEAAYHIATETELKTSVSTCNFVFSCSVPVLSLSFGKLIRSGWSGKYRFRDHEMGRQHGRGQAFLSSH